MTRWTDLSQRARGIVAIVSFAFGLIGGAFALGAATRDVVTGHRDLPERVSAVEVKVATLDYGVEVLQAQVRGNSVTLADAMKMLTRIDRTLCRQVATTEREMRDCDH